MKTAIAMLGLLLSLLLAPTATKTANPPAKSEKTSGHVVYVCACLKTILFVHDRGQDGGPLCMRHRGRPAVEGCACGQRLGQSESRRAGEVSTDKSKTSDC